MRFFLHLIKHDHIFLIWREFFEPPEQKTIKKLGHILIHNCVRNWSVWSWSSFLALLILRQRPVLWIHGAK